LSSLIMLEEQNDRWRNIRLGRNEISIPVKLE
jgi:hypothetical protein